MIWQISIHALREEGDARETEMEGKSLNFYPRPPRGGRPDTLLMSAYSSLFLSTPSARRATIPRYLSRTGDTISIHALREEGDGWKMKKKPIEPISIHALREEGDRSPWKSLTFPRYFYPRPPRGGRRPSPREPPRAGYFYPRPPRGGRPAHWEQQHYRESFLSTPSARRATRERHRAVGTNANFYPRPPRGGRPVGQGSTCPSCAISIHALREEGDDSVCIR